MAVEGITDAQDRGHTVAGRWSGSGWAILPTRDFPGKDASLASVSCPSATFCLTVGGGVPRLKDLAAGRAVEWVHLGH